MKKNDNVSRYGIKVTLPSGDSMAASHLLGDDWESVRWFTSEESRDEALTEMQNQPVYYRRGDTPTVTLEKVQE